MVQVWTHVKDKQVVVDQVLHDLHLVLPFPISLEQTGSKQQRQVLGAHLVQVGTLLDPEQHQMDEEPTDEIRTHAGSFRGEAGAPAGELTCTGD